MMLNLFPQTHTHTCRCKPKADRRLPFENFLEAMLMLAMKRYPHSEVRQAQALLVSEHLVPLLAVRLWVRVYICLALCVYADASGCASD